MPLADPPIRTSLVLKDSACHCVRSAAFDVLKTHKACLYARPFHPQPPQQVILDGALGLGAGIVLVDDNLLDIRQVLSNRYVNQKGQYPKLQIFRSMTLREFLPYALFDPFWNQIYPVTLI